MDLSCEEDVNDDVFEDDTEDAGEVSKFANESAGDNMDTRRLITGDEGAADDDAEDEDRDMVRDGNGN